MSTTTRPHSPDPAESIPSASVPPSGMQTVHMIGNRLSLRTPQKESLELLARVCDLLPLEKGQDVGECLRLMREAFPSVDDFEREFPSICFALATGVGKTRLMGAFIAYLSIVEGLRHFFVLAPNITIYTKLIDDFSNRSSPKYVFRGLHDFAINPPEIITGDNYEGGRGVRRGVAGVMPRQARLFEQSLGDGPIHINIFNIDKINNEVRGGKAPKIKRLHEYIGESYFEYLSRLPDLVLLMDESHRYRASAGIRAINELNPILGLELTATPQIQQGTNYTKFRNIIYSYPLSNAIRDGYVKIPAVATRQNFNRENYDAAALEKLKLEDGIRMHEETKAELQQYAAQTGRKYVKPFVLVVARDTTHAKALVDLIDSDVFFEGAYKGRAITVHSNQKGEEKTENVERLLEVEKPENDVEIVIHVDMLKEGWDVTNLYTIVPLRTADSRTLVEQSIGRGLRLPFDGKRTGVPAADRLTIVAHERFQAIIDEANRADSLLRGGIEVRYVPDDRRVAMTVQPRLVTQLIGDPETTGAGVDGGGGAGAAGSDGRLVAPGQGGAEATAVRSGSQTGSQRPLFTSKSDREAVQATIEVIGSMGTRVKSSVELSTPEVRKLIEEKVRSIVTPAQGELEAVSERTELSRVVEEVTKAYSELTIDIPRVVVVPRELDGDAGTYRDFELDLTGFPRLQPVADDILIRHLDEVGATHTLRKGSGAPEEQRLEDYIIRGLIDFDDISYDDHADLLYKLAGQVVDYLRSYLTDERQIVNVLAYHQGRIANLVHAQMEQHYDEADVEYEPQVTAGFVQLGPSNFTAPKGASEQSFREKPADLSKIRSIVFTGFRKCLYPLQKFDSDAERQFACMLENDSEVLKWFKPARKQLEIYMRGGTPYEPDFVVETETAKYLCEPKMEKDVESAEVREKARVAAKWCKHASAHAAIHGTKPWHYALIPHNVVRESATFDGLVNNYLVVEADD